MQTYFVKQQIVNILGIVGQMVSVATLTKWTVKAVVNERCRSVPVALFTKIASGYSLLTLCRGNRL